MLEFKEGKLVFECTNWGKRGKTREYIIIFQNLLFKKRFRILLLQKSIIAPNSNPM